MGTIFKVAGIAVVAVVATAIFITWIQWERVPGILAHILSQKLQVAVTIDDVDISPSHLTIEKLVIGNPPEVSLPKALSAEEIDIQAPLTRYLDKKIVIDEIVIDNIYLGLEFHSIKGTQGNWTTIMANAQSPAEAPVIAPEEKRVVQIRRLVLNNIIVDIVYRDQGGKVKRLPPIRQMILTDINTAEGLPTEQIMHSILGQMLESVFRQQNLQNMLKGLIQTPGNTLDTLIQPFKDLLP